MCVRERSCSNEAIVGCPAGPYVMEPPTRVSLLKGGLLSWLSSNFKIWMWRLLVPSYSYSSNIPSSSTIAMRWHGVGQHYGDDDEQGRGMSDSTRSLSVVAQQLCSGFRSSSLLWQSIYTLLPRPSLCGGIERWDGSIQRPRGMGGCGSC